MDIAKVLDYGGENLKSIFSIYHLVALHNIILNIREVFNLEYRIYTGCPLPPKNEPRTLIPIF